MKYPRLLLRCAGIWLARDFAYKGDFFIKLFSMVIADLVGPLTALFIYQSTLGIPGWSFEQLLLFQGTLIFVFGLARVFANSFVWWALDAINEGEFDKYLLKPYSELLYLLALTVDPDGFGELFFGISVVVYAFIQLGIPFLSFATLFYVLLILAGFFVHLGSNMMIVAMGFLAVKSEALIHLYAKLTDFARYPLNVYSVGLRVFLTFLLPIAVSSFYPAEILLHGVTLKTVLFGLLPVIIYFSIACWVWKTAIKKYASAGG